MLRLEADEIASVADHDLGLERQLAAQCRAQLRLRAGLANDERPRGAEVHDVEVAQLACESAWAKRPVSTDVDAAKEDDESHAGSWTGEAPYKYLYSATDTSSRGVTAGVAMHATPIIEPRTPQPGATVSLAIGATLGALVL